MSGKGALGGAATGASMGSLFGGPIGAGVGGGLGALLGLFSGDGSDSHPAPELEQLYRQQLELANQQNPLVEAAYRLAFNRLPNAARMGLTEPNMDQAWQTVGNMDGGEYDQPTYVRSALRLMQMRQNMANPIVQAVTKLALSRMPTYLQSRPMPTSYINPNASPDVTETGDPNTGFNRGRI